MTTAWVSPSSLLALPSELIESILISSRSPRTVSSLAQTCHTLRTLVYASPDSHLWRELFLTTWDDPRPALEHRALIDPRIAEESESWDWGAEYRRRVAADKCLKAWRSGVSVSADPLPDSSVTTSAFSDHLLLSTLRTILHTILTLTPFPASPPIALTVLTPSVSPFPTGNTGSAGRNERMTSAPPLPPLLLLLATEFKAVQPSRSATRLGRMVYGPHASSPSIHARTTASPTTNADYPIPTPCLPPQLTRTLFALLQIDVHGLDPHVPRLSGAEHWAEDEVGDVFHRIVCITGFAPIPRPLPCPAPTAAASAASAADAGSDQPGDTSIPLPWSPPDAPATTRGQVCTKPFPTPTRQYADARTLARRRVYDMKYLRGDRMWGPYQVVGRYSMGAGNGDANGKGKGQAEKKNAGGSGTGASRSARGGRRQMRGLGTLAWAMGLEMDVDSSSDSADDDDDDDWRAEEGQDAWSSDESAERDEEEEGEGGEEPDDGEHMHVDAEDPTSDPGQDGELLPGEPEDPVLSFVLSPITTTTTTDASSSRHRRSNPRRPPTTLSPREIKPYHLKPDYAYLASVRIVVEANLRELFSGEGVDDDGWNLGGLHADGENGVVGEGWDAVGNGADPLFWEDEDVILRASSAASSADAVAHSGSSSMSPGASVPRSSTSVSSTTPPSSTPTYTGARTFELSDVLAHFRNIEVARVGSGCGYWGGWVARESQSGDGEGGRGGMRGRKPRIVARRSELENDGLGNEGTASGGKDKGKGKGREESMGAGAAPGPSTALGSGSGSGMDWEVGPEGGACEGWDWAGVAGIWRRCVCWMDYRELLFFNLDPSKFISLDIQEARRIIPMELRITGYTRAGLMPISEPEDPHTLDKPSAKHTRPRTRTRYFRPPPVIHFTGSSVGSDRGLDDGRTVSGSAELIGGGEVRWQMDTYSQESSALGSSAPEWSSEAVQIGGVGSAVGLLGMWTGAEHERADPLGPFWAWKVA
ncbi:hypothetical protein BU15DRAFT_83924 [Melanogaster broomeanus]|nr:hypothetical protein BU15DRAFT_83924 [Melanogaster broomeanus]